MSFRRLYSPPGSTTMLMLQKTYCMRRTAKEQFTLLLESVAQLSNSVILLFQNVLKMQTTLFPGAHGNFPWEPLNYRQLARIPLVCKCETEREKDAFNHLSIVTLWNLLFFVSKALIMWCHWLPQNWTFKILYAASVGTKGLDMYMAYIICIYI